MNVQVTMNDGAVVVVDLPRPGDEPLEEAQRLMIDDMANGVECPCCGQNVKVYRRNINSGMAATLIWLVRTYLSNGRNWIKIKDGPRYVVNSREIGKLRHWNLVKLQPMDGSTDELDEDKKTSGMWKPTKHGGDFAMNKGRLPKYVYLYNNKIAGFGKKLISIVDALGKKFSYSELMAGDGD